MHKVLQNFICHLLIASNTEQLNTVTHSRINEESLIWNIFTTRMWANAQPDGRPAEHRWRPLFNAAKFG